METVRDIRAIMDILPHRFPFLLIDRIVELEPEENRVVALKNVTINEPFFQGHFPGVPIMPGVLLIEAMAQAGCILGQAISFQEEGNLIYFMGMDKVKFRKPVVPGDQLIIAAEFLKVKSKIIKMKGVITVDGQVVAEAELLASKGA